jgi:hypothetical protein
MRSMRKLETSSGAIVSAPRRDPGLAASAEGAGAAPSKLQRPAGNRVKTDARDAAHLAKLPDETSGRRTPRRPPARRLRRRLPTRAHHLRLRRHRALRPRSTRRNNDARNVLRRPNPGRETNTAYLYERASEQEYGQAQPDGMDIIQRHTTHHPGTLARAIIANDDDQPVTAHDLAAQVPNRPCPTVFATSLIGVRRRLIARARQAKPGRHNREASLMLWRRSASTTPALTANSITVSSCSASRGLSRTQAECESFSTDIKMTEPWPSSTARTSVPSAERVVIMSTLAPSPRLSRCVRR